MAKKSKKKNSPSDKDSASKAQSFSAKSPEEKKLKRKFFIYTAFVVIFSLILFGITNQKWFNSTSAQINEFYAHISSFVMNIFGAGMKVIDQNIGNERFTMSLKKGCDALAPMILYTVSIATFPVAFRHKWKAILTGILALSLLNIVRITTLSLIGQYSSAGVFDFFHETVWQIAFIIFTIILLLRWLGSLLKMESHDQAQ